MLFLLLNDVGGCVREVFDLEELTELDFRVASSVGQLLERDLLFPLDGFAPRLDIDDPVAGDELLRFRERTVCDNDLSVLEPDTRALRARVQPRGVDPYARIP